MLTAASDLLGETWVFIKWDPVRRPVSRQEGGAEVCCWKFCLGLNSFRKLRAKAPQRSGAAAAVLWAEHLIPRLCVELIPLSSLL